MLRILPHLLPDSAAAVAFILATSAEDSALHRTRREDIQTDMDAANLRVHIRGSKNDRRDRWVPIVSDEQRLLLAHAATHAQGVEGKLFRSLGNLRHGLLAAAKKVALEPLPRHALRKAAGQWLIDLSVPLEASFDSDADGDCRICLPLPHRCRRSPRSSPFCRDVLHPSRARSGVPVRNSRQPRRGPSSQWPNLGSGAGGSSGLPTATNDRATKGRRSRGPVAACVGHLGGLRTVDPHVINGSCTSGAP